MQQSFFHIAVALFAVVALTALQTGCAPSIGDSCEVGSDCPGRSNCDVTAPGGYCLRPGCEAGGCPDTSICIEFDRDITYCMASCHSDDDCRDGYVCRRDHLPDNADLGFCYVEPRPPASGGQ